MFVTVIKLKFHEIIRTRILIKKKFGYKDRHVREKMILRDTEKKESSVSHGKKLE
jgi:hypothetical protein